MKSDLSRHPCFSASARHKFSRVHLPVAPRCNMQCNFCNRKFDCMNESRPGVSSGVLTPEQALAYLASIAGRLRNLSVVGIAGPGDPMANPEQSLKTLELVRREYPEMLLCLATNGLNLPPYLDELAALDVSHVTVTMNAVDPEIGATVYGWMRYGKRVHKGLEAASYLLDQQLKAIRGLSERGITAKVNCILMEGINDHHVEDVARIAAQNGAELFNLMPLNPVEGTAFSHLSEPGPESLHEHRIRCGEHLLQMSHCSRCRADAAGMIGVENSDEVLREVRAYQSWKPAEESDSKKISIERPYVAVASREGMLINQHLGAAEIFRIFGENDGIWKEVDSRMAPPSGYGDQRWSLLADSLQDCAALFVSSAGNRPLEILERRNLPVYQVNGLIQEVLSAFHNDKGFERFMKQDAHVCGSGCGGTGMGCG